MKKIAIFFSFDNGYVPQAGVTFVSLLTNASVGVSYELLVLHSEINIANQNKLLELIERHTNGSLSFIKVEEDLLNVTFSDEKFQTGHAGSVFTKDTLYRCIPDLITQLDSYDKIIYSDVDIVVVRDISELWDIEMGDAYVAGVKAPEFLREERTHLPAKFEDKYLAGGLWVMNLKKLREDQIGKKALEIMKNPPVRLIWNDQDVMNLACDTNVKYISYQYISIPDWLPLLEGRCFKDEYYPNAELKDCMFAPKIIHYAARKPWSSLETKKADLWYYWLEKSGFEDIYTSTLKKEHRASAKRSRAVILCFRLLLSQVPFVGERLIKKKKNFEKLGRSMGL